MRTSADLSLLNTVFSYVNSLCSRIQWLESIVRARCPDVDLDHDGPTVMGLPSNGARIDFESEDVRNSTDPDQPLRENPAISLDLGVSSNLEDVNRAKRQETTAVDDPTAVIDPSTIPSNVGLSHEVGLVSLGANRDPRYIGPSSGYILCKLSTHLTPTIFSFKSYTRFDQPRAHFGQRLVFTICVCH